MTKNIIVLDEQGNRYGATYAKRAKGLVKNGRARFMDEHTICLACPPSDFLEDNSMEDIKNTETTANDAVEYSIPYVLMQIKHIQDDLTHIQDAMQSILNLPVESPVSEHVAMPGVAKAQALANIVQCRETTNQQLLKFYEKMYEDLRGGKAEPRYEYYQRIVSELADKIDADEIENILDAVNRFFNLEK